MGIGVTTCVGIGGDPVPGTTFVDCLAAFEDDPDTRAVMMIGEIGGTEEEKAAAFIAETVTKPVVCYIAGVTAPPGRRMGHAGAIISGSKGTAQAKMEALAGAGAKVARNPTEAGELMAKLVRACSSPRRPCPQGPAKLGEAQRPRSGRPCPAPCTARSASTQRLEPPTPVTRPTTATCPWASCSPSTMPTSPPPPGLAAEAGAALLARGAGTSLAGQALQRGPGARHVAPHDADRRDRPGRRLARVEPGVVLDDLRRAAERYGLTFGPTLPPMPGAPWAA